MPMLSSILGFSLFGLSARIGQLGIQKRNLLESMSSFPSSPSSTHKIFFIEFLFVIRDLRVRSTIRDLADPGGHLISMLAFGYLGYWAHRWDERATVLIAEKRAEIAERRKQRIARAEEASAAALAEAP
jgi:hypothetical protein